MFNKIKNWSARKASSPYLFEGVKEDSLNENEMFFCTGMGRSGTHFLAKLVSLNKEVASYHLDEIGNPVADSFYQFAKWYNINIDQTELYLSRRYLASEASKTKRKYFESNPYLNLHTQDLLENLDCKILILYRDPLKVIESHFNKGWYSEKITQGHHSVNKIPGYNYIFERANHFFGRFQPRKETELRDWLEYSQVGKIAWMWSAVYKEILKGLNDKSNLRIVRTEQIDYATYKDICNYLNIEEGKEEDFLQILDVKPGKAKYFNKPKWSTKELEEFEILTTPILSQLDSHPLRIG